VDNFGGIFAGMARLGQIPASYSPLRTKKDGIMTMPSLSEFC
jgi:hypothetical protein